MSETADLSPVALALGRIPTGLYVVSTRSRGTSLAFVGSLLAQVGFDPPTLCVAIARGRDHLGAIRAAEGFAVSILDDACRPMMGAFFKPAPGGGSPFDGLEHTATPGGHPVLTDALAWLDCRLAGEHDTGGDHVVLFGTVEHAELLHEGEPAVHLRRNGLTY